MIRVFWDMMLYRWVNVRAPRSFETSGITHTTTRRHMTEDMNPQQHRCEHLQSCCRHKTFAPLNWTDIAFAFCTMPPRLLTQFGLLPWWTESGVIANAQQAARCDQPRVELGLDGQRTASGVTCQSAQLLLPCCQRSPEDVRQNRVEAAQLLWLWFWKRISTFDVIRRQPHKSEKFWVSWRF